MKRYIIDLRPLEPKNRKAAYELIDGMAFISKEIYGKTGLEGIDLYWDSSEDFTSSPVFPQNCPCREV